MLTVFINEGIKMDKCPKNMTLNIFGLITILDFFQDTFVSIFKTKRPSDYFAFFSFLLCGGQAYFYIFVFGLLGSTTGRGPHFFKFIYLFIYFFKIKIFEIIVSKACGRGGGGLTQKCRTCMG